MSENKICGSCGERMLFNGDLYQCPNCDDKELPKNTTGSKWFKHHEPTTIIEPEFNI